MLANQLSTYSISTFIFVKPMLSQDLTVHLEPWRVDRSQSGHVSRCSRPSDVGGWPAGQVVEQTMKLAVHAPGHDLKKIIIIQSGSLALN